VLTSQTAFFFAIWPYFSVVLVGRGLAFTKNAPIKSDNESFYIAPVVNAMKALVLWLYSRGRHK
jgi:hypothetical protein